jgi:hypothetical protein
MAKQEDVTFTIGKPTPKQIAVSEMVIYPEVQRDPPSKKMVEEITRAFNPSALGTMHVSQRADGTLSVMDGQRRRAALEAMGLSHYRVNCLVYTGLTVAQEAALFRLLNRQRIVSLADDYSKGVVAGDERDVGIEKTMAKLQWKVSRGTGPGLAACVKPLRTLWDYDGNGALLNRTVTALNAAFGRDKGTMCSSLVAGMGKFLANDGSVDQDVLADKLKAKFSSPVTVVTLARQRQDIDGGSLASAVAKIIQSTYENRKRMTR